MTLDLSALSPQDGIAALRSYPRRFSALLCPISGDDTWISIITRPGPEGMSALDITRACATRISDLSQALDVILIEQSPQLPGTLAEPATVVASGTQDVPAQLRALDAATSALASRAERVPAGDWGRAAHLDSSDGELSALDVLREAVRTGSDGLHKVEETINSVRRA